METDNELLFKKKKTIIGTSNIITLKQQTDVNIKLNHLNCIYFF